jgi:hypothetical protein
VVQKHCQLCRDPHYKATWDTSYANELGRLCQGIGTGSSPHTKWVAGTNTLFLIKYHDIPIHKRKKIYHTMVVCEVRPEKDNPYCTRITIDGNRICFLGDVGTNTPSLELVNLLLNSMLSCPGARFSSIDLKNFYHNTPMPDPEYACIKIADIPAEFIEECNLQGHNCDGLIYLRFIRAVMACPRPAFLPTISSSPAFLLKDITRPNPPQASGVTNGIPSNSASLMMTLGWSMLG